MTLWGRVIHRLLYAVYRQRVVVLLFLLIAVSAGAYYLWLDKSNLPTEAAAAGTAPVEVTVQDLQGTINNATLTLQEKSGNHRRISMAVGTSEALAIAKDRGNTQIPPDQQPQAYSLMRDAIQQMGGRIDRVIVNDATQNQYLAQIVLSNGGDTRVIKARPGDAIALALQSGAPIYVEDKVLERFGSKGSG
ncbi:MAG: bifunctional nuclease family protein [Chloroflexi bacterium]|nr:bifunctional nuclease family protein [Chloroflexota bacterium]MBV9544819.1 bifunctional nuclease family protein [Chloroflexota bacterium]